jgi:hypothetical protein
MDNIGQDTPLDDTSTDDDDDVQIVLEKTIYLPIVIHENTKEKETCKN